MKYNPQSEQKYRDMTICPACNKSKQTGCLVCWDCFKYKSIDGIVPFKYYLGDIESYLREVKNET